MFSCFSANSTARSKAPLFGSPVPTLSIVVTPASRARAITSSRSASYSGPSMWQWESMNSVIVHVSIEIMRQEEIEMLSKDYDSQPQREINFFDAAIGASIPSAHRLSNDILHDLDPKLMVLAGGPLYAFTKEY